jgi:GNAT superfamily N-acetyltransferase
MSTVPNQAYALHRVQPQQALQQREALAHELAQLLIACVHDGASVSFMAPLSQDKAQAFWHSVLDGVQRGERILLIARDSSRDFSRNEAQQLIGTVQLITAQPDNQPHRADVAKMLVHPLARKQGLGEKLMRTIELEAQQAGKTLLVLDTVTQSAGWRLYQRCGWQIAGDIPDYALLPFGGLVPTTYMYKAIAQSAQ